MVTQLDIALLTSNYVIDRTQLTDGLNVRADTTPYDIGGVEFYIGEQWIRTEVVLPYSLGSNYYPSQDYVNTVQLEQMSGPITIVARPFIDTDTGRLYGEFYSKPVILIQPTP